MLLVVPFILVIVPVVTFSLTAFLGPEMVALSMAMKRTNDAAAVAAAAASSDATRNRNAGAGYAGAVIAKKHESTDRSHQREERSIRRPTGETSNGGSRGRGKEAVAVTGDDDEGDEVYEMDFDDDAVDLQKFRAKLDRAKDDKQLKKLEAQLVRASEQVSIVCQ